MNSFQDAEFEHRLRTSLGTAPEADFDAWLIRHGNVIEYLSAATTDAYRRQRRWLIRLSTAAVAVAAAIALMVLFSSQRPSLAQAGQVLERATTITWTTTFYERRYSRDGKRSWLHKSRMDMAYLSPHHYRDTRYNDDGSVHSVQIIDTHTNRTLHLDMRARKATWMPEPTNQYSPAGPFASVKQILTKKPIEFVGQKEFHGTTASIFRYRRANQFPASRETVDIWISANTKELLRVCDPGTEGFDPDALDLDIGTAEVEISKGELLGSVQDNLKFNPGLASDLFALTPPEGFDVAVAPTRPTVNEAEMIEWLGATARFNDGMFYKDSDGFDRERFTAAAIKERKDQTEAEQLLLDINYKHMLNRNGVVLASFANEHTPGGRFRYLGNGARLGDSNRIVLYYKLKSTGQYRAVFGDLSVRDIAPEQLPLPIEE